MPSTRPIPRATYDDLQPLLKNLELNPLCQYVASTEDNQKLFQNWRTSDNRRLYSKDFLTPEIFEDAWNFFQ